jgi:hypothetical protein
VLLEPDLPVEVDELLLFRLLLLLFELLLVVLPPLELLVVVVPKRMSHDDNAEIPRSNIAAIINFFIALTFLL